MSEIWHVDLPRICGGFAAVSMVIAWTPWLADMGLRVFAGFYLGTPNPRHHGPPKKTSRQFAATLSGVSFPPKEAPETVAVKCREVFFW